MKATIKYKVGNVNMFDYAANEKEKPNMPVMYGTYHDGGYKVANDGNILLAVKDDYAADKEGKVLQPDGTLTDGYKYPKWRMVIPCEQPDFNPDEWDWNWRKAAQFYSWVENNRAIHKEIFGKAKRWSEDWTVYNGGVFIKAKLYDKLCKAMELLGADVFYTKANGPYRAVYAKTDKGWVLVMPVYVGYVDEEIEDDMIDVLDLT